MERGVTDRIALTLAAIEGNRAFFIHEASLRGAELAQLADISGFELVVLDGAGNLAGSSLPAAEAGRAGEALAGLAGDRVVLGGAEYRVARAGAGSRSLFLLAPEAPVKAAKERARRPLFLILGLALAASLLLGSLIAGTVTRPLARLAARAAEAREGNLDAPVPAGGGGEVGALAAAFGEMVEGLRRSREALLEREKMATLGRFSAAVAHELRNPLSGMRMTAQMVRRQCPPGAAEDVDFLLSEMARLDHGVEELLFFAGEPRYARRETDLREAVAGVRKALSPLARHLGLDLTCDAPDEAVLLTADGDRVRQALMNLVLNALQASPPGGTVQVRLGRSGDFAALEVEDGGPGVPEEMSPRLFTPFVSGREGGTGLGLSVTRSIARAHGGDVTYGRVGGRTVFRLTLSAGGGAWRESS